MDLKRASRRIDIKPLPSLFSHASMPFIEVGIIILVREIAVSTLSGEIQYSLMASGGVLLLALAIFVIKRSRAIGK